MGVFYGVFVFLSILSINLTFRKISVLLPYVHTYPWGHVVQLVSWSKARRGPHGHDGERLASVPGYCQWWREMDWPPNCPGFRWGHRIWAGQPPASCSNKETEVICRQDGGCEDDGKRPADYLCAAGGQQALPPFWSTLNVSAVAPNLTSVDTPVKSVLLKSRNLSIFTMFRLSFNHRNPATESRFRNEVTSPVRR